MCSTQGCERVAYARGICKRCYDKEQYVKHREKKLATSKAAHERRMQTLEGRESVRATKRRYREAHPERTRAANRDSMARQKARDPDGYAERQRIATRRIYTRRREMIDAAKSVPCSACGGAFPTVAMDLHHRDPATKLFTPSQGANRPEAVLAAEIAKCDVLCSNCHRLHHHAAVVN